MNRQPDDPGSDESDNDRYDFGPVGWMMVGALVAVILITTASLLFAKDPSPVYAVLSLCGPETCRELVLLYDGTLPQCNAALPVIAAQETQPGETAHMECVEGDEV